MKNLKKVLAMVLAFACTFTMFASAKVYEDVQPGSEFSEAITMLSDLGIIQGKTDGKYHPEETITRAEACALIARLLTGDPNVSNFGGAQNFTDVVKGSWQDSAIGYCVANGITVGVGNGKFEPNRAINDQEFLTMMVRALGYETPDVKQGYPFSYMTVANAIGLRQDTEMMANTDALRGEDAQVIYNAMFVDYAKGAKMINTTHGTSVEKYPTLAESVWGLDRAALGTFSGKEDDEVTLTNCKAHTWVIVGADKKAEGRVLAYPINDDTTDIYESDVKAVNGTKYVPYSFKYEGDADALKGYQVELWGEGKHGTPTWEKGEGKFVYSDEWNIKAIKTVKGQTKYDYDASKADAKSDNGTIELGESKLDLGSVADNAKNVSAKNTTETTQTTYLSSEKYNGESVDKDKNVEKALNIRDGAQYKLMDWDSDGNIDWIVVDEANYFKVESANSKRLTVTSMKSSTKDGDEETQTGAETQTWKLDGLNDEKNYKVKFVAPEGVKEGDILEVTYKTAYDKGEKCEVVTATATVVDAENQELDKVSTKNNLVLTFNGETKQLAQNNDKADTIVPANPTKYIDFDEEELGTEFALYMNRNGFIVYSDYATESSNYLMVLDTDNGEDGARPKLGALKILTSDNKVEKNVEVVSDLRIDGKTSGNGYEKNSHSFVEDKIVGNVYKYWKDADGRITKMESMIDASKADNKANNYEYVSKNDRLTLDGKSYALKDAKVIFAVKPHDADSDYIQHVSAVDNDKRVDEDDVIAVKAADIPDISKTDDTLPNTLDKNYQNSSLTMKKSWIGDDKSMVAIAADKNKDVDAAVLGVNNFNKFNAGSTKVGLVTNVSYDKNDVVSIDVATNGKVETLSSVEKTSFDDVVSVLDYTNKTTTKSYSVASRTEKISNGLMANSTLKDYLNKNGAYAEITTNADGKLTGVLFMDEKTDYDGHDDQDDTKDGVNVGNVVIGDYYQVSRKVVADVKEGSWMSVIKGSAEYADADNFKTLDTKDEQKAADFTSDATYYLIDGKPTKHSGAYVGKASVVDGFDGNPDIKVAEASDVRKSDIRNDGDSANDIYNVADVASKIDDNGAGDIVAVYMYDDDMGEKISIKGVSIALTANTITVGQDKVEVEVKLGTTVDSNLDVKNMYVQVVDKDGKVVVEKTNVTDAAQKLVLNTKDLKEGTYTVQLFGYNKTDKNHELIASAPLTVGAAKTYAVTGVEWVKDANGTEVSTKPYIQAGTDSSFYVKLTSTENVASLTAKDLEVRVKDQPVSEQDIEVSKAAGNSVFKIIIKNKTINNGDQVAVTLKAGGTLTFTGTAPNVSGNAEQGTVAPEASPDAAKAKDISLAVDSVKKGDLRVQVMGTATARARVARAAEAAATTPITTLKASDFKVTVDNSQIENIQSAYDMSERCYVLTSISVTDWTKVQNITVSVGEASEVVQKMDATVKIEFAEPTNTTYTIGTDIPEGGFEFGTLKLTNLFTSDVQVKEIQKNNVPEKDLTKITIGSDGKVSLDKSLLDGLTNTQTVKFKLTDGTNDSAEFTVTAKDAPKLADTKGSVETQGVAEVPAVAAKATFDVNFVAGGNFNVQVDGGKEIQVTAATGNNETAKAVRDALNKESTVTDKYTVGGENAQVILTAKTPGAATQNIELTTDTQDKATIVINGKVTPGKDVVPAVKGVVNFTFAADAVEGDKGQWTLTVNSKTFKVTLTGSEKASEIAKKLETEVNKDDSLSAVASDTKLTITEKDSKEGTIVSSKGITTTFVKG